MIPQSFHPHDDDDDGTLQPPATAVPLRTSLVARRSSQRQIQVTPKEGQSNKRTNLHQPFRGVSNSTQSRSIRWRMTIRHLRLCFLGLLLFILALWNIYFSIHYPTRKNNTVNTNPNKARMIQATAPWNIDIHHLQKLGVVHHPIVIPVAEKLQIAEVQPPLQPKSPPTESPTPPPPQRSIAACLLVMDDTIKLTEWLAYHYTILPLGRLIVAIDPNSHHPEKILSVLDLWKDRLEDLQIWTNDSFLSHLREDEFWPMIVQGQDNVTTKSWFHNKTTIAYQTRAHKRRQNYFVYECLLTHKQHNQSWVLHTDTDEFLLYNYPHNDENASIYDTVLPDNRRTVQDIDQARIWARSIRDTLPRLGQVTIADFLYHQQLQQGSSFPRCFHIAGVSISAQEQDNETIANHFSQLPLTNQHHLLTLRHRHYCQKQYLPPKWPFSKAILDLSRSEEQWIKPDKVQNSHNPNRRICGDNGSYGSGTDYIASILRIHHHVGTYEAFLERSQDARGHLKVRFQRKDCPPLGVTNDVLPWIQAFVDKVGIQNATKLLHPIEDGYAAAAAAGAATEVSTSSNQQ